MHDALLFSAVTRAECSCLHQVVALTNGQIRRTCLAKLRLWWRNQHLQSGGLMLELRLRHWDSGVSKLNDGLCQDP